MDLGSVSAPSAVDVAAVAASAVAIATVLFASAAQGADGYRYAGGVMPVVTFEFRDGVETHEFPVFEMETDLVGGRGSPEFTLIGVVGDAPHLHRMLDAAFERKQSRIHEWNYKHAEITVDFVDAGGADENGGKPGVPPVRTLSYSECMVADHRVTTLGDDQESYVSSKTGFAVVDRIGFLCSGLYPSSPSHARYAPGEVAVHNATGFDYYGDIRAWVEFAFDGGSERMEFPYFELTSGYGEGPGGRTPSFAVEGVVGDYPLLHDAVENARAVRGAAAYSNTDFEAIVEFEQNGTVLRGLEFDGCRVASYRVATLFDKEEGFMGKSGFVSAERIGVECTGLEGKTPRHDGRGGGVHGGHAAAADLPAHAPPAGPAYSSSSGLEIRAVFEYDGAARETAVFPVFRQGDVMGLVAAGTTYAPVPPAFELAGRISDLPRLYGAADQGMERASATGPGSSMDLFDVDVQLAYGAPAGAAPGMWGKKGGAGEVHAGVVRGFEYRDCRVTDYVIKTQGDKEEAYFGGFAHSNTFGFECLGYHPYDPVYDALSVHEKPDLRSSIDYEREQRRR